ncbi:hypothetical protein ACJQWK_04532 [Exserohilum turcicum]
MYMTVMQQTKLSTWRAQTAGNHYLASVSQRLCYFHEHEKEIHAHYQIDLARFFVRPLPPLPTPPLHLFIQPCMLSTHSSTPPLFLFLSFPYHQPTTFAKLARPGPRDNSSAKQHPLPVLALWHSPCPPAPV